MVANGFEGVAWMTGGGAEHSAGLGRLVAYAASGGISGIVTPDDLRVVATTPTADAWVHVGVGAAAIRNRYPAARSESYYVRNLDVTDLQIPASGSSARSHLIIVQVEDPQFGGQSPTGVGGTLKDGPYVFPRVISDVSNGTIRAEQVASLNNKPAYAIARVDMPANATTVQQGYITQIRQPIKPSYEVLNSLQKGPVSTEYMLLTDTSYKNFPTNLLQVPVPLWATHADIQIDLLGLWANNEADMDTYVDFGGIATQVMNFDYNGAPPAMTGWVEKFQYATFGSLAIPLAMRGTVQTMRLKGRRVATQNTGTISINNQSQVRFRVEFFEKAS